MNALTFTPLVLAAGGLVAVPFVARVLTPRRACLALCAIALGVASSTVAALLLILVAAVDGGLAHHVAESVGSQSLVARAIEWCGALYDHRAPVWAGAGAAAVLVLALVRAVRSETRWRRAVAPWRDAAPVEVVPGLGTDAFAVPGRPGAIVVGQGLFDALDPDERRVVLAHERAHLDLNHHLYLRVGDLAAAVPLLGSIAGQIRYATERCADEAAAVVVGDRHLVARTIIKAALTGTTPSPLPAASGGHVTARVDALLNQPAAATSGRLAVPASLAPVAAALIAAAVQVHHLGAFLTHASHGHL